MYSYCSALVTIDTILIMLVRMETSPINTVLPAYPKAQRTKLQQLRKLVHATAKNIADITALEESLKWGQPSFNAKPKGIGSSVRLDKRDEGVSMYFICTTGLVEQFRDIYPDKFNYIGNREIHFALDDDLHEDALSHCISMALTYHAKKKKKL